MAESGRQAFVCGHPIAHSRSPLIHAHWLSRYGVAGTYERIDVKPAEFARFVRDLPASGFVGGNVTLPHKEAAALLISARDEAAEIIGAVNTLWLEDGRVHGGNTDAEGFAASLDQAAPRWRTGSVATVLGAGGASRAVLHALQRNGYRDIRIVNRTRSRALELVHRFAGGVSAHEWDDLSDLAGDTDLLVNTTSLGVGSQDKLSVDMTPLPAAAIVCDIVYVPLKTAFLRAAEECRLQTVDGLGMLLHQAAPGFERWFGLRPEITPQLRSLVVADLENAS